MKIGNLTRLFEALSRPNPQNNNPTKVQNEDQAENARSVQSQQAVQVGSEIEQRRTDDIARQERVANIKRQVDTKTYPYDSEKVAEALYRELFV